MQIDLTCDLGRRSEGVWIEADNEVWPLVSSVAIACGGHAGDPRSMLAAAAQAAARQVMIGAALGYRDPACGGERFIDCDPDDLTADLLYQLGGLDAVVVTENQRIEFVRAAGALGEATRTDRNHAWAVVNAVLEFDSSLTVVGPAGSRLLATAERHGLATAVEYQPHRSSAAAGCAEASIEPSLIGERALAAVTKGGIDSIWLPSGTAAERAAVAAVRQALTEAGYGIAPAPAGQDEDFARLTRRAG